MNTKVPKYLSSLGQLFESDPRKASQKWFKQARYGLFLHYGLYSIPGRHEWLQYNEKIPVAEYEKLMGSFTAHNFDADNIARFAVEAGMSYVNITTCHHDGFCLYDTAETGFNSLLAPAGRDLVKELSDACDRYGLGLFLYYSHGRDWRHPHAPNNDCWGGKARPDYVPPEPSYAYGRDHDLNRYIEMVSRQVGELLTNYSPVAGIWLDGIGVPLNDKTRDCPQPPRRFNNARGWKVSELYDRIRSLSSYALVSYKQGLLGTEDFFTVEHRLDNSSSSIIGEMCTTLTPGSWGYSSDLAGRHMGPEEVWRLLSECGKCGVNMLLNTGLLPDGSLDPEDMDTLLRVSEKITEQGFPAS